MSVLNQNAMYRVVREHRANKIVISLSLGGFLDMSH